MKSFVRLVLLSCFIGSANIVTGQSEHHIKEIGTPFIENYMPEDYNGHHQVWAITKDSLGVMYFAVTGALLSFDGINWRTIKNPDKTPFRKIFLGPKNTIYYGEHNGFGYLDIDSTNSYFPRRLHDGIAEEVQKVGRIKCMEFFEDQLLFLSRDGVYSLNLESKQVALIPDSRGFVSMKTIGGRLLLAGKNRGLYQFENDQLTVLPDNDYIKAHGVSFMSPYLENELLLLSSSKGFLRYDFKKANSFDVGINKDLIATGINSLMDIGGRYTSIATRQNGLFIIDREGNLVKKLDEITGLESNKIHFQYLDEDGSLWLGTNYGISHVFLQSPISTIGFDSGFEGSTHKIKHHNGLLYLATNSGLFYKSDGTPWQSADSKTYFYRLGNFNSSSWSFETIGNELFCGTTNGLLKITEDKYVTIDPDKYSFVYGLDQLSMVAIGLPDEKHYLFKKKGDNWVKQKAINGFEGYADFIYKATDEKFWLTDSDKGVFSYYFSQNFDSFLSVKKYGVKEGLPKEVGIRVFPYKNAPIFASGKGVFRYNELEKKFHMDSEFEELIGSNGVFRFREMPNGDIYHAGGIIGRSYIKVNSERNFELISDPFVKTRTINNEYVYPLDSNNMFIATNKGMLHYDPSIVFKSNSFKTIISSVHASTNGDSLLFGGAGIPRTINLAYSENALKFKFASTFYDESSKTVFSYQLNGFEGKWSDWSTDNEKEYTNLPHGNYSFLARSRNVYNKISQPVSFDFTVLPPWYFTKMAYFGYLVLFVLLIWLLLKINSRRLEKDKVVLQEVIKERTLEISEQKMSIEKQAKKLLELDKVKSRFFANISHELRTPITLINGPVQAMLNGQYGGMNDELKESIQVVHNNGANLIKLVNEILDLTKLEAAEMKLVENPVLFYFFLEDLFNTYDSEAKLRKIEYSFDYQYDKEVTLLIDEAKCGKVVNNLLSNAFKYTPDEGKIELVVVGINGELIIKVRDTGPGIHDDDKERIFDRFYQSERPESKAVGGTGIGLALAMELAKLQEGKLYVNSMDNQGSEFVFTFQTKIIIADFIPAQEVPADLGIISQSLEKTIKKYVDVFKIDQPKLLITEDHDEMRAFISQIISPFFQTFYAKNGVEALSILENEQIDLIISDVMMPKMDGFELLKSIKKDERFRKISIIMLTARAAEEDKIFALTMGVDDYLTKPFSHAELQVRAKNIMANRILRYLELNDTTAVDTELTINEDSKFLNNIKSVIEKHVKDSLLTVSFLASAGAVSERSLRRRIKSLTGFTPLLFIREVKLHRAKELLESKRVTSVAEASYSVGMDKVSYFSQLYVDRFGKKPSESLDQPEHYKVVG